MIVFLNSSSGAPRCGVYQMGKRIGRTLVEHLGAHYCAGDANAAVAALRVYTVPRVVVYNWHPWTMPWAEELVRQFPNHKHVGLVHEMSAAAPHGGAETFPYRMVCDPTFPANNQTTFRSVRHVPRYDGRPPQNARFTVGSFGFAGGHKLFPAMVKKVSEAFVAPLVRLHIPYAYYVDGTGELARGYEHACRAKLSQGAELEITHDFLDEDALLDWLGGNDLNVFFYEKNVGSGASSSLDYAIAVRRPIAVNGSYMFRHVHDPLGKYPETDLATSARNASVVERLYREWSPERLAGDYKAMLEVLG